MSKVGRNDLCPCGSGKKFKKCCEKKSYLQKKTTTVVSGGHNPLAAKVAALSQKAKVGGLFQSAVQAKSPEEAPSLKDRMTKGKIEKA